MRQMITAMSIVTAILVLAGLALVARIGVNLYDYIAHDGYGRPRPSAPPRSHYAYFDDPRRIA